MCTQLFHRLFQRPTGLRIRLRARLRVGLLACWWLAACMVPAAQAAPVAPDEAVQALDKGQSVDLIVEYESSAIDREMSARRKASDRFDTDATTQLRATRYADLKARAHASLSATDISPLADYSHLPLSFKRVRTATALQSLLAQPQVKAVYLNKAFHRVATANLNLVAQPAASAVGYNGAGSTVAVLDDGIDYTNAAFGGCTAPGTPASCLVSVSRNFGTGSTDTSHGTNVSAIVVGMAPAAKVAMLNVFSGTSAYSADILSALNWAFKYRSTYNIVAINMSLGDGSQNTSPCSSNNPYLTPVANARTAGITVVAAAGNDAYSNAISMPACTPGVVSVGAVYADSYGGFTWGNNLCTDYSPVADKVACFSDSASFLTLWAPGAMITAGGVTEGGTSQASPHVAGAVAVLRAAFPNDSLSTTQARLTTSRTQITDTRNGQIKPRLDLEAAARPANDNLANRATLSGNSGTSTGTNRLATQESGEPLQDSRAGGHTVWWKWVAPASGQVSLDTHGSNFDTLLSVSSGTTIASLHTIASNDDDGSSGHTSGLLFEATAGAEYAIAVDGINGAQGDITLNWTLNTAAQANLAVNGITGPGSPMLGNAVTYTISVSNSGPQSATQVVAHVALPSGVSLLASTAACQGSVGTVNCPLGTMGNGATASFDITVLWNAGGTQGLGVSVSSDLPDSQTSNNSTTLNVSSTLDTNAADAPTLPEWATMALASLMLFVMARGQGQRH